MDATCPECKKGGAVNGGICVKCAHKNLRKELKKRKPNNIKQEAKKENTMNEKSTEFIKYTFTEDEKKEIASVLAQKVTELQSHEDQKKAVMSDLKSQIDGTQAKVNNLAVKLNNGYEMRNEVCDVEMDAESRMVYFYLEGTRELVKERPMRPEELQYKMEMAV